MRLKTALLAACAAAGMLVFGFLDWVGRDAVAVSSRCRDSSSGRCDATYPGETRTSVEPVGAT